MVGGAYGNLSDIDVAIGGGNHAETLLADALTLSGELSDGTEKRSLTAGVGVNFNIEHEGVHIFAKSNQFLFR